jgi:hypothetical protein
MYEQARPPTACAEKLLPSLAEEFEHQYTSEEIRVCADAALAKYADAPVRSFVLVLARRDARALLTEKDSALLA